ncbi:hypothetical protein Tco_0861281 [Tanacetum coccineum]|uniref:Uncharacterized protein n=1 Tax=Tanacetum coccineum TaxID=301880 RepID=A0ABQ5BJ07_9ASTR
MNMTRNDNAHDEESDVIHKYESDDEVDVSVIAWTKSYVGSLTEVVVTTGDDDPLFDPKAKLYRFDKDGTSGLDLILIPETTFVGVESRVLIPETNFVGVESMVLIVRDDFMLVVESRVIIPETTVG